LVFAGLTDEVVRLEHAAAPEVGAREVFIGDFGSFAPFEFTSRFLVILFSGAFV
jgi:hypothetical protein